MNGGFVEGVRTSSLVLFPLSQFSSVPFLPPVPGGKGHSICTWERTPSLPSVTELEDQGYTLIFAKQGPHVYWVELFNANRLMSTCIDPLMGPDKF